MEPSHLDDIVDRPATRSVKYPPAYTYHRRDCDVKHLIVTVAPSSCSHRGPHAIDALYNQIGVATLVLVLSSDHFHSPPPARMIGRNTVAVKIVVNTHQYLSPSQDSGIRTVNQAARYSLDHAPSMPPS